MDITEFETKLTIIYKYTFMCICSLLIYKDEY